MGDFLQEQTILMRRETLRRSTGRATLHRHDRARILPQLKKNQPKEARALAENFLEQGGRVRLDRPRTFNDIDTGRMRSTCCSKGENFPGLWICSMPTYGLFEIRSPKQLR